MPSASDTPTPALAPAGRNQRQEPVLNQPARSDASPLPASIAGAFAAAAYSMQHSLQHEAEQTAAPEEEDSGLLPQLYASRLSPRSRDFYLAQFKRFDALDRSLPSWNMAAAFLTLAWCCLHGLWREAGKYLAAVTATALIWWFGLRPALPEAMALGLGIALWLVAVAVPGLLGNGWYWRKIRAQTLQAITDAPNMAAAHAALQAQVGSPRNRTAAMLVLALPVAAAAGAGLALLPADGPAPSKSAEPATTAVVNRPAASPDLAKPAPEAASTAVQPENRRAEPAPTSATETDTRAEQAAPDAVASVPSKAAVKAEPSEKPPARPATDTKEQPVKDAPSTPHAGSDLVPGKFYLNLGVYSEAGNADKVLAQLQKSRLPALTQKMASNKGEVTRVRSGPFESRKRAEKAARKLQAANIDASIFQSAEGAHKP
ncbi:SPOR domain-containing protein [Comamonas thiooxydans]|uniref:SPOR domain-containing protein n=1 Tax=Comamonas thiooxydans TaxID=363952 RepID=UPI000B3604AD|nr:SPOR domain-containing protein [Comamonas thiooxydans]BDR11005.1 SPOR domain-containing protein [Comamonas thiooxydans]